MFGQVREVSGTLAIAAQSRSCHCSGAPAGCVHQLLARLLPVSYCCNRGTHSLVSSLSVSLLLPLTPHPTMPGPRWACALHLCGAVLRPNLTFDLAPLSRSHSSNVKVRSLLGYVKRKLVAPPTPPYSHVCQVGDPVLRLRAAAIDPASITGAEVQKIITTMVKVMRCQECVGLSAPQVGVPARIVVLEYPERLLQQSPAAMREARGLSALPLRIIINPELRVLDHRTVLFREACESIAGFSAVVPRYLSVEVTGLDERGQAVTWRASGWQARMVQHEIDHLDGRLFIDSMDSNTFINIHWQEHND